MAKLYANEVAVENGLEGIQANGGYGYTTEYDGERCLKERNS